METFLIGKFERSRSKFAFAVSRNSGQKLTVFKKFQQLRPSDSLRCKTNCPTECKLQVSSTNLLSVFCRVHSPSYKQRWSVWRDLTWRLLRYVAFPRCRAGRDNRRPGHSRLGRLVQKNLCLLSFLVKIETERFFDELCEMDDHSFVVEPAALSEVSVVVGRW